MVLSIRSGFEKEFLSLMEGDFSGSLPNDHAYMSIADELEAMAKTNYPYTADANLDKEEYLFTWDKSPAVKAVASNGNSDRTSTSPGRRMTRQRSRSPTSTTPFGSRSTRKSRGSPG